MFTKRILLTLILILFCSALSSPAQSKIVPFLDLKTNGLLGGIENGKFLNAKTAFAKLKGAEKFSVFDLAGKTKSVTATIKAPDANEPCDDFYYAETGLEDQRGLAVGAANLSWNPLPRTSKPINLTDKTYLGIVSQILRSKGLPRAKAILEQAVKIDLDGDGKDEVLLTASSYGGKISPQVGANNYSFVLLRKIVAGQVKNIFLAEEYVKKSVEFGAPNRFEVSGIADLNGDGKLEVVVFAEYYEGSGASVYEMRGDKPVEIKTLGAACGV